MKIFDIGDPIILRAVFEEREGTKPDDPFVPFDPAKVVCTVEKADGKTIILKVEAEEGEVGAYVARLTPVEGDPDGKWEYAFDGFDEEGEPAGTVEDVFRIRKRKVPRA